MLTPNVDIVRTSLQQAEIKQIEALAKKIRNTKHLRAILKDARPDLREEVYDLLAPLLEFDPPPYSKMMKAQLKREKGRQSAS